VKEWKKLLWTIHALEHSQCRNHHSFYRH
jgi:hypothetical protein